MACTRDRSRQGAMRLAGAAHDRESLPRRRRPRRSRPAHAARRGALARADVVASMRSSRRTSPRAIPKTAEVVYVGKRASAHALPQDKINQLLIDEAKKGKTRRPPQRRRSVRLRTRRRRSGGAGRGRRARSRSCRASRPRSPDPRTPASRSRIARTRRRSRSSPATRPTTSTGIKWEALAQLDGTIVFMMGFGNLASHRAKADRERRLARSSRRRDLESDDARAAHGHRHAGDHRSAESPRRTCRRRR